MHKRNTSAQGFTIVELLIVVVMIAILAAISIVAYRGISDRANTSAASSEASQAAKKVQVYFAENESYPTTLAAAGITNTDALQYAYSNTATPKTFCITATSGNKSARVNNTTSTPTEGGCAGHGQGGVAAVTNLVRNPNFELGTTGWQARGPGVTTASNSTNTRSGNGSIAVQMPPSVTQNDWGATISPTDRIAVSPGETLTVSAYFSTVGGANACISINWRNSASTALSLVSGSVVSSSSWNRSTLTATAPTGAAGVDIYLVSSTPSALFYADDVMVAKGNAQFSYADGNSPNWVWNGTPNASTSTGPAL